LSFTLELEFSCSVLLDRANVTLEATSDSAEARQEDNAVQLSVPIRYQPDLFLSTDSNLRRYEIHPPGTFPHGPGPEFRTTVKVQNLGCFPVRSLSLLLALPALGPRRVPLLPVTRVLTHNVSPAGGARGVPAPAAAEPVCAPPQATCVLRTPPEGTAAVVPVQPEDLQRVER
ncbi:ITA10 protein, partial [Probosciger aterrimus]|nr:ITA10 protein [Probosciger aterrimus]